MKRSALSLLLFGCLALPSTQAQDSADNFPPPEVPPTVTAIRADGKITVDGQLNEEDWEKVSPTADFFRQEPRQGGPIRYRTEVKVLFDDTYKHAVWNKTEETRVVLFCDIFRTDLPKVFQPLNRWVYGLREKSQRLKNVLKNAEVQVDLKPEPSN